MNLQIDIQQKTQTADSFGQMIDSWSNVVGLTALWCSVKTTGGAEFYAAQKINAETSMLFKLRYIPGITNLMRVVYNSKNYEIINVNNVDEANEFLLLSCKEVK